MAAPAEAQYSEETLLILRPWTPKLLSFRLTRPQGYRFTPGQFARLGLISHKGARVWRAYSMVSAPWDDYLDFYSILVPDGQFTSRLAELKVGDTLRLDAKPQGFFTVDRFVDGRDLWLLATGTGLAPYLSILQDPAVWARFENIVLVHGVQVASELTYHEEIAALRHHPLWAEHGHKLRYQAVTTRDDTAGALHHRLPLLLASGELETGVGLKLDPEHSRLMICGNPQMVEDTHRQLMQMGYRLSRLKAPAQLALENGW